MANDKDFLKVEVDENQPVAFLFLFINAQDCYVAARWSLTHALSAPSCLLARQCVELFIKAILRLDYKKQRGHNLITLLQNHRKAVPYFGQILTQTKLTHLLSELSKAYESLRYGESRCTIDSGIIIQLLDELAYHLRKVYLDTVKAPDAKLYIASGQEDDFLCNNRIFSSNDISTNPLAHFALTGDLPPWPPR